MLVDLAANLDAGELARLRAIGVVLLIVLLVGRELAANASPNYRPLARWLAIGSMPLIVLFVLSMASITFAFLAGAPSP